MVESKVRNFAEILPKFGKKVRLVTNRVTGFKLVGESQREVGNNAKNVSCRSKIITKFKVFAVVAANQQFNKQ